MTRTASRSEVLSISHFARICRAVFGDVATEIFTLHRALAHLAPNLNIGKVMADITNLAFADVIADVRLEVYRGSDLLFSHIYTIADDLTEASGPAPEQMTTFQAPEGAQLRIVVTPNPERPKEYIDRWFQTFGWSDAPSLKIPQGAVSEEYGAFWAEGNYGVKRGLLCHPAFVQPAAHHTVVTYQEG